MSADRHALDPADFVVNAKRPSAVYAYVDQAGNPLGATARFEAGVLKDRKTFVQHRYEAGAYIAGLNGLRLPIFAWPEVAAAIARGETIYIVEGEKCVQALRMLGLVATCNPGGAKKWLKQHADALRGAHVVIIPDNDTAGREHAEIVAASLDGIAASVRILRLDGLGEGEDVVEWLQRGGSAEKLNLLKGSAPVWIAPLLRVEEWPTPIPFSSPAEASPFLVSDALPELLAEYAQSVARSIRLDVAAPGTVLPVVISACVGNAYCVEVKPDYFEKNLSRYLGLAMASAERKTAFFAEVTEPLVQWEMAGWPAYERAKQEFDARDKSARADRRPRTPKIIARDPTTAALTRLMHANGGAMSVMSGDARHLIDTWLGQYRRDGGADDSVFLNAHGGDAIGRERIGTGPESEDLVIYRPQLAVAACIQPDKLEQLAKRADLMTSGFLPRTNFVAPRSLVGTRFETGEDVAIPANQRAEYANALRRLIDERFRILDVSGTSILNPVIIKLSPGARARWAAFANELEAQIGPDGPLAHVASIAGKTAGEAVRLAALFHLFHLAQRGELGAADRIPISEATWILAENHQRRQFDETRRVLHVAMEPLVVRLARNLVAWAAKDRAKRSRVPVRDILGAYKAESAPQALEVLSWLRDRGWVRPVERISASVGAGWEFHPAVFGGRS